MLTTRAIVLLVSLKSCLAAQAEVTEAAPALSQDDECQSSDAA